MLSSKRRETKSTLRLLRSPDLFALTLRTVAYCTGTLYCTGTSSSLWYCTVPGSRVSCVCPGSPRCLFTGSQVSFYRYR